MTSTVCAVLLYMKIESLIQIVHCLHAWCGFKGLRGAWVFYSDEVLRMHRALHTHQTSQLLTS